MKMMTESLRQKLALAGFGIGLTVAEADELREVLALYERDRRDFYALHGTLITMGLDQHPDFAPYLEAVKHA